MPILDPLGDAIVLLDALESFIFLGLDTQDKINTANADVATISALLDLVDSGDPGKSDAVNRLNSVIAQITSANNILNAKYGSASCTGMAVVNANGNVITVVYSQSSLIGKAIISASGYKCVGTLTDAPISFLEFGSKLYINNGTQYLSYDGSILKTVDGYIPKIAIGTPPAGGGTDYEQINLLTGKKRQTFSSNGSTAAYQLRETNIDSVDSVYVSGVLKTLTTHYTVSATPGTVTFTGGNIPATGTDNVEIYWTKGLGQRSLIEGCRFSMDYSGSADNRVFLWGNNTYTNRRFWSGIADSNPSAEYFEANSYDDVGNFGAITDIVKQYDRQKIFLENGAMYSYYETQTIGSLTTATFPAFELHENIGNVAEGQVRIINNSPLSLYQGIHAWQGSTVRDQTNQKLVSNRIQDSLIQTDLSTAVTCNWQKKGEYWCNVGDVVWIYNYVNDTWYKFDNITATRFIEINGQLFFTTSNGTIEKFDDLNLTDNGAEINAMWEMGFYDFEAEWLTKFLNNIWVSIKPQPMSRVDISFATNNESYQETQTVSYQLMTFQNMNFGNFSFNTSYNPQPKYVDLQAQGFCYFKVRLSNSSKTETATILSLNMPVRYGGKIF